MIDLPVLLPALPFHPLLLRARWLLIFLVQLSEGFLQQQNDVTLGGIRESSYDSTVQDFFFDDADYWHTTPSHKRFSRPERRVRHCIQSAWVQDLMACDLAYKGAAAGTQKDEVFW